MLGDVSIITIFNYKVQFIVVKRSLNVVEWVAKRS